MADWVFVAVLGTVAVGATVGAWLAGKRRRAPRVRWQVGLRVVAALAIVVALGEPYWRVARRRTAVVCLWDVSSSVSTEMRQRGMAQVDALLKALPRAAEVTAVAFGETVAVLPDGAPLPMEAQSATNLESALGFAVSLLPPDGDRRIVLVTDGAVNQGDARAALPRLRAEGVPVTVVPLEPEPAARVRVAELRVPATARRDSPIPATVVLASRTAAKGRLRLLVDGETVAERDVSLAPGTAAFEWTVPPLGSGEHALSVVLNAPNDENSRATARTVVAGEPRVLYVAGGSDGATAVGIALRRAAGVRVESCSPERFPADAALLEAYDGVVYDDVSANRLTDAQQRALGDYVRDGGGWFAVGGAHAFGAGDWDGTPLEDAAPVTMEPQEKKQPLALLLLLDKSGSMAHESGGAQKLTLAARATQAASDALRDGDALGVIAFDAKPRLTTPFAAKEGRAAVLNAVAKLRPGSGTDIARALDAARDALRGADAPRKHVVLLSDGQSEGDLVGAAKRLVAMGATVSAVAVGSDAAPSLSEIAAAGGGTFTALDDLRALPRVLMREARRGGETLVQERSPVVAGTPSALVSGTFPPVEGYIAATPKPAAQTLLKTASGDPILVSWRHGFGKGLAFLSDGGNRWTRSWAARSDYASRAGAWLRWTLRSAERGGVDLSANIVGAELRLSVVFAPEFERTDSPVAVRVRTPDETTAEPVLARDGAAFVGALPLRDVGSYDVVVARGGESVARRKVVYEGGAERSAEPDAALLAALAAETGGSVAPTPEAWARSVGDAVPRETPLSGALFGAGLGLVLAEWVLRRWGGRLRLAPTEAVPQSLSSALLRAKARVDAASSVGPVVVARVGSGESPLSRLRQAKARAVR